LLFDSYQTGVLSKHLSADLCEKIAPIVSAVVAAIDKARSQQTDKWPPITDIYAKNLDSSSSSMDSKKSMKFDAAAADKVSLFHRGPQAFELNLSLSPR